LATARNMVEHHHYARGGSNTSVATHGLFRVGEDVFDGQCVGVCWWIPPTRSAAEATHSEWQRVLSLSRLVIVPGVPPNACSFLLARSRKLLDRVRWVSLVTYADQWRGHSGAIYRADNWDYVGLTKPERVYVKNGRMLARKTGPKTRTHSEMLSLGAECIGVFAKHKYRRVN
jgi:hypothetical protein